jgi:hypothetical protein
VTRRILSWSGPRNLSTALMRSFEARGDCHVVDEPLYAAFLARTGKDHPGRDLVLASQPQDPQEVLHELASPAHGLPLQYEKHMAHHWQPDWPPASLEDARHLLLIRDPARVVASYARVREAPLPADLGVHQQLWWLEHLERLGRPVVVLDGDELLQDPPRWLAALCGALGIEPTARMERWPPGRRPTDGVWAPFWYGAVEASTTFGPPPARPAEVPADLQWVVDALRPAYERLAAKRLSV